MKAPEFWDEARPSARARLLQPIAAVWAAIATRRLTRPGQRAPVPVICVGNFVLGGAGKTPVAIAIARTLIGMGETPFFLSRGYGGAKAAQPRRIDPTRNQAAAVGDEPLLLARTAPTIVCADRWAGARAAIAAGASVVVLDDGLQNPSLEKDLTFAVVDAGVGVGNGLCPPAGPLRAPLTAQWPRVQALAIVGEGDRADALASEARRRGLPVLDARLEPDAAVAARLRSRRVVAFAGIGRPQKFFDTLSDIGAQVVERESFADHHRYARPEIERLVARARQLDAMLVTTEKDAVRLPAGVRVDTLPVTAIFSPPEPLEAILRSACARRNQAGAS